MATMENTVFGGAKKEKGETMIVDDNKIRDMNHVRMILNNLRTFVVAYEEQMGELPEDKCENIGFQIAEIDGFIIGKQKYNAMNLAMADIRAMSYWEYIEGKCDFDKLVEILKKYEGEV